MENNTELLKEYASLAGREDAKSEARKAEILSYIKTHANDADREEAKAHPIYLGGNFLILQKIYTFVP